MRITPKQQAFALAYIELQNCSAAYRAAYNTANMKPKTVHEAASRLLKNSKVAARIAELTAPAVSAAGLSIERTLLETARMAYSDPGRSTARTAPETDRRMGRRHARRRRADRDRGHHDRDHDRRQVHCQHWSRIKKLKFWDKNAAIDKAIRHLGAYVRDNAPVGEPSLQVVLVGAPTNERARPTPRRPRRDSRRPTRWRS